MTPIPIMWLKPLLFLPLFTHLGRFLTLFLNSLSALCHHALCVPCILQLSNSENTQMQLSFLNKQLLLLGEAHKMSTQELQNMSSDKTKVVSVESFVILFVCTRWINFSLFNQSNFKKYFHDSLSTHFHGPRFPCCHPPPHTHTQNPSVNLHI